MTGDLGFPTLRFTCEMIQKSYLLVIDDFLVDLFTLY